MNTRINEITYTIEIKAEELVTPEMSFEFDEDIKYIREQIEIGNPWAWCYVKVTASYEGFTGYDTLGGCSYKDEEDFKQGGYYENMCHIAKQELLQQLEHAHDAYEKLVRRQPQDDEEEERETIIDAFSGARVYRD